MKKYSSKNQSLQLDGFFLGYLLDTTSALDKLYFIMLILSKHHYSSTGRIDNYYLKIKHILQTTDGKAQIN